MSSEGGIAFRSTSGCSPRAEVNLIFQTRIRFTSSASMRSPDSSNSCCTSGSMSSSAVFCGPVCTATNSFT
eukprot:3046397-Alexandrium_andersonii.AAC.1